MTLKEMKRRYETGEKVTKATKLKIREQRKRECSERGCHNSLAFRNKNALTCGSSHKKPASHKKTTKRAMARAQARKINKEKKQRYYEAHGIVFNKNIKHKINIAPNTDYLPADTPVFYSGYKEPLRPVEKGKGVGYYGTLAFSEDKNYVQCHICGNLFSNLGGHVRLHRITAKAYKKKFGLSLTTALIGEENRKVRQELSVFKQDGKLPEHLKEYIAKVQRGEIDHSRYNKGRTGMSLEIRNKKGLCPDQVLERIRELADELGHTPSYDEFNRHYGGKYMGSIKFQHGSYLDAVSKLGMKSAKELKEHTSEQLIENIEEFYKKNKRIPMTSDFNRGLLGAARGTYIARFGSLNNARVMAGLNAIISMPFGQLKEISADQYLAYKNGEAQFQDVAHDVPSLIQIPVRFA